MIITVYGKAHLKGTSRKTGRDYNFYQLHYLGKARGVEGMAASTVNLDPSLIPFEDIEVGLKYDLEPDFHGNIIGISLAD